MLDNNSAGVIIIPPNTPGYYMADAKTSHYGISMKANELKKWAKLVSKFIVADCKEDKVIPVLIYTGMSGITAATALALHFPVKFRFILEYVRKEKEESHGCRVENSDSVNCRFDTPNNVRYYLVDDFICSGATLRSMLTLYQTYRQKIIDPNTVWVCLSDSCRLEKATGAMIPKTIKENNDAIEKNQAKKAKALKEFMTEFS